MSPTVDRERNFAPSHQHTFICIHSRQWMELYNKPSRGSFKVGWNGNGMGLAGPGNMHLWTTGFLMNKIVQPLTLATLPPSAFEWNFLFMSSLHGADSISVMFSSTFSPPRKRNDRGEAQHTDSENEAGTDRLLSWESATPPQTTNFRISGRSHFVRPFAGGGGGVFWRHACFLLLPISSGVNKQEM